MTRKSKNITLCIAICVLAGLAIASFTGVFGTSANNIEQEARKSQKIDSSWEVSQSVSDGLCALIFYNETLDDYTYSIYLNRKVFSMGYFFRSGGSNTGIIDGIREFTYDTNGSALISMNKDNVAKIELNNGVNVTNIDVNPAKPFAIVIPTNCGSVTLFDINGNVTPITVIGVND